MKDIEIRELFRNREEYAGKEIVVRGCGVGNRSIQSVWLHLTNDGTFFFRFRLYEASED